MQRDDGFVGAYRRDNMRRDRSLSRDGDSSFQYGEPRPHDGEEESHHKSPPPTEEWPPCFDKDGSSFVFDSRSAMFYESLSDFFYDPKSKLYYGNRKGAYFRYDGAKDPPFVEVQKVSESAAVSSSRDGPHNTMDQVPLQSTKVAAESSKPKIAIKLKIKMMKSSSGNKSASLGTELSTAAAVSKSHKEKIANIEKWTEKQAELKQNPIADAPTTVPDSTNKSDGEVRMTVKGEPICVVCRRKFPNIDKLRLHERASELHKQNLQKLKEKEFVGAKRKSPEETPSEASVGYQDRAEKRRQLHGPDGFGPRSAPSFAPQHEPPSKGEALDESHVGHKMLQKMGWKGSGNEDASSTRSSDHLRKEWDRIESLAGNSKK